VRPAEQPTPPLIIRGAENYDDIAALHVLAVLHAVESGRAKVNERKLLQRLVNAFGAPAEHALLMATRAGRLIGYLFLRREAYSYSDAEFLSDFGFYVLPPASR